MIFTRASRAKCENLKLILGCYSRALGQLINFEKSVMCYSKQVSPPEGRDLASVLGVQLVDCHERYLGLPSFVGHNKSGLFRSIINRDCFDISYIGFRLD
ncbi:hypothetical protein ACOSQ2_018744 [Xanthoceras sorbifolium]